MELVDKPNPQNSAVLVRGEPNNRGQVWCRASSSHFWPRQGTASPSSGERTAADASSWRKPSPAGTTLVTARVIVNRVWQWHFGQALVRTVSDFGTRSDPPTHPELLDWLATSLMDNGWSLKKLHKLMVMSATYQQDSKPVGRRQRQHGPDQPMAMALQSPATRL